MSRVRLNIKSVEKRREWRGSLARERCNHLVKTRLLCREEASPIPIAVCLADHRPPPLSLFSANFSSDFFSSFFPPFDRDG